MANKYPMKLFSEFFVKIVLVPLISTLHTFQLLGVVLPSLLNKLIIVAFDSF